MSTDIRQNMTRLGFVAILGLAIAGCGAEDPAETDEAELSERIAGDSGGEATARSDAASLALLTAPAPASPLDLYIESITTGGGGCPEPEDVTSTIDGDRKKFTLLYDTMILEYPPGPKVKVKNCAANIKLHVPPGLQVAIATVTTRGVAELPRGAWARQTSQYFFAGSAVSLNPHSTLTGPYSDPDGYEFTDHVAIASLVWSSCGESEIFTVNTRLTLNMNGAPAGASAYFNAESASGKFEKVFHLIWKAC